MKLKDYLEMAIDIATPPGDQKIQIYKGSKDNGEEISGASIKFAGSITGNKKDTQINGKPVIIYYLTDIAAKSLLDAVALKYKMPAGAVDEFIKNNSPIPFTNGAVELDISSAGFKLTEDMSKIK